MNRLRIQIITLTCWLVAFFGEERLSNPVRIHLADYVVVFAIVTTILFTSRSGKIPVWTSLSIPILLFLVLKIWFGGYFSSNAIIITIFEAFGIIVATLIAYWMSISIRGYECTLAAANSSRHYPIFEQHSDGLGYIYREVRRARNHQHPLALLAIAVDEKSSQVINGSFLQGAKAAHTKLNNMSEIANTLCNELEDCAIIVQGRDHFLVALPDTRSEEVPTIIERLHRRVAEQVRVGLIIGMATLPQDGYTFEGLVDKATGEMKAKLVAESQNESNVSPTENIIAVGK